MDSYSGDCVTELLVKWDFSPIENPSKLDWCCGRASLEVGKLVGRVSASTSGSQRRDPIPSFMRGVPLKLNHHRQRIRSLAERHHFAIGLALTLVGLAAVGALHFLGVRGSLATMIGAFAVFALLFGQGFRWNRGPIFPPSEINRQI